MDSFLLLASAARMTAPIVNKFVRIELYCIVSASWRSYLEEQRRSNQHLFQKDMLVQTFLELASKP
jgi:hypothetical protein